MQKRLPRKVTYLICALLLGLLLACSDDPGEEKWSYRICQDSEKGQVCHYEYMTRNECNAKYGPGICG